MAVMSGLLSRSSSCTNFRPLAALSGFRAGPRAGGFRSALFVQRHFDVAHGAVDDIADAFQRLRREGATAPGAAEGFEKPPEALHDVAKILDVRLPRILDEALVEVGDLLAVCL